MLHGLSLSGRIFPDDLEHKPYIQRQQILNWTLEDYTWADWERYMRSYYAVVEQVDDAIGILIEELEKEGLTDHTMIVYTADHGDAAGSHGMLDKHYVMYEEEVHVPLIVRWDGVVEAGSRCDAFICHALDLAATIPEIAGFEFASAGASLMPLLTDSAIRLAVTMLSVTTTGSSSACSYNVWFVMSGINMCGIRPMPMSSTICRRIPMK